MKRPSRALRMMICAFAASVIIEQAHAFPQQQGAGFSYQGLLTNGGSPINGNVDLQFKLFDEASGGTQIGSTIAANAVDVDEGIFAAVLDFGALAINGDARWLEIAVASPASGGGGPFTTLTPRQKIESVPYATYALNAALGGSYANAVNFSNAANAFAGDGSGLTNLAASSIATGVLANARTTGTASSAADTIVLRDGSGGFSAGAISATSFTGDGSGLTNLNASNITSGTLDEARLSASLLARIPQDANGVLTEADSILTPGLLATSMVSQGGYVFLTDYDSVTLQSYDATVPGQIVAADSISAGGTPLGVFVSGNIAYVSASSAVRLFDIADPTNLVLLSSVAVPVTPRGIGLSGNHAFVACASSNLLQSVDVSNPASPALVSTIACGDFPIWVKVIGNIAYVACLGDNTLRTFDVTNPASMVQLDSIIVTTELRGLAIVNGAALVINESVPPVVHAIDVSDPADLSIIDILPLPTSARDIAAYGNMAVISLNESSLLMTIDASDPSNLAIAAQATVNGVPTLVAVASNVAYVLSSSPTRLQTFQIGAASYGNGAVQAAAFNGSGAGLTNLNAAALTGVVGSASVSGAYANSVTFSNASNSFAGSFSGGFNGTFNGTFTGTYSGSGAALTSLNAANIASGNLAMARMPTGGNWFPSSEIQIDGGLLTIDPVSGNVGIGTVSPDTLLDINGLTRIVTDSDVTTTIGSGGFNIVNSANTAGLLFDTNEIQSIGATLAINSNSLHNTSIGGAALIVTTGDLVGINRTPVTNNLEVGGTASKTTAGDWLANSDRRIKKDVRTVSNALDTLDRVRLTSFRYTPAYLRSHPEIEDRAYLNVIAQEFAQVFPEHVKGSGEFLANGSEILQVDTHPLTIYSAAAIQDLHRIVRERDAHIRAQSQRIEALENDVEEIRSLVANLIAQEKNR